MTSRPIKTACVELKKEKKSKNVRTNMHYSCESFVMHISANKYANSCLTPKIDSGSPHKFYTRASVLLGRLIFWLIIWHVCSRQHTTDACTQYLCILVLTSVAFKNEFSQKTNEKGFRENYFTLCTKQGVLMYLFIW